MIAFAIFLIHIIFFSYIFRKISKKENVKQAFYNLLFMIIIFTAGWAFSTMIANAVFPESGYSVELSLDTISLLILTLGESMFYKFYYADLFTTQVGKEK